MPKTVGTLTIAAGHLVDWGEAPDARNFCGRDKELAELKRWIVDDGCRVVIVLGIGGVGKTTLAAVTTEQVKEQFEYVVWRSLQNAPPLRKLLEQCILSLSNQQQVDLPKSEDDQLSMLIGYLREHRCLLVLDNMETLLRGGDFVGQYREGYEGYSQLLQRIGEVKHQSCLLLTSREKPKEIVRLEGKTSPTRALQLIGLTRAEGQKLLMDASLTGSDEAWSQLISLYSGNPLYLKLVSEPVHEMFGGDISKFLKQGKIVLGDIHDPLDFQFARLSIFEREIMYWLAIEREPVSLDDLQEDLVDPISERVLFNTLNSLRLRSLLEKSGSAQFTLQPVIMEYVTDGFIELIYKEILSGTVKLFGHHSLIKAQAKDFVRESQVRIIAQSLIKRLLLTVGEEESESKLTSILAILRETGLHEAEYAAGNVLNLLVQLGCELQGVDFSHLRILQAYLHGVDLHNVNFSHAHFEHSIFTGAFGAILSLALSPDGKLLATGCDTGEIWLWQIDTGVPLHTYQGHTSWVLSVAFSPDGKLLASGSQDLTVRIWDVDTNRCCATLRGHTHRIWGVAFSPDGALLVSASHDRTVRVWDVVTGQCLKSFEEPSRIWCVACSPQGKLVATGSDDGVVWLWNIDTGRCVNRLQGHHEWVRTVAFSPAGKRLVSGGVDATIRVWDVSTGECLLTLREHSSTVRSVCFGPNEDLLASVADDRTVRLWDISTGQCLKTMREFESLAWHWCVAFSQDGQMIVSGSEDQAVRFWDVNTGRCFRSLHGYTLQLQSVAFSGDGQWLASGGIDQVVRLWDVASRQHVRTYHGHKGWVRAVDLSLDGTLLASGGEDQIVRLWDASTGRCLKTLYGHTEMIWGIAFSPDGKNVASGSEDRTIRLWDVETGQCLKKLETEGNLAWVWAIAISPDGQLLASGHGDHTVRIWDITAGQCLKTLQGHPDRLKGIAFSPDGKLLASSCEGQVVLLWEVSSGRRLMEIPGHTDVINSVAFSLDGSLLATGSDAVHLWSVDTGQYLRVLQGHSDQVRSVRFSPKGDILASASCDGTIKFWDIYNGACLSTLVSDRPYEHMNITNVQGLTEVQKSMLKALGAIEEEG